ncbi:MAG TPA: UvrD-helicase domain-containing protein [Acidobacteriaceae bacterium]|jgi:ATP-dependent exoDNAse (exonuclease V) beta subunit
MSTTREQPLIADAAERARALDPRESFLVQAPAGSGKTELLVLRYLALLPYVQEPEQVLAITFTRKATAEMRVRVLRALEAASHGNPAVNEHEREVRRLAKAALDHAQARDWQLIEQPQRLNIQTIDSLALSIAHQTPLLSHLGGDLAPIEDARPLYALAAERTLAHLGDAAEQELADALEDILKLRDANLLDCESLIAGMLARRDQWLLVLPGIVRRDLPWEELQTKLEAPFRREHAAVMRALQSQFARTPSALPELLELARIACDCGMEELTPLRAARTADDLAEIAHWQALCCLLLTQSNTWRKRSAIPAKHYPDHAARLAAVMERISGNDALLSLLSKVRKLPPAAYSEEEWRIVRSIFVVLRHAIAQLRVVFAEQNVIDFAEAGIAAHAALENPSVLMRLDERVQHLLVDEFQDTSRPHFALLRALLEDWQHGDGRTCFLVGDPMQSIYLFRDAESRLFHQVREHGIEIGGASLPLTPLQLSTNFRSIPAIVAPLNDVFERILGADDDDEVQYAASVSSHTGAERGSNAMHLHVQTFEKNTQAPDALDAPEADAMIEVIRAHMPAIQQAQRDGTKYRVAVLARARTHLVEIIARLRREQIPFRGVKIDLLRDRPEILDLLSLFRALLHPSDRIAWLAVLRAPWCGLTIPALHAICGDPESGEETRSIPALIHSHKDRLDPESRSRSLHTLSILEQAQAAYAAGALAGSPAGLALWLERTWHALGAPLFLNAEALANCEAFFAPLGQMPASCFGTLDESLNQRLEELYAQPDPSVSESCGVQLMTIHSAKGLEFEVVLVPQLQKPGKNDDPPLFQWLVRRRSETTEDELLLAPIGYKHGDKPRLYEWVGKKSSHRLRQEEKRLLYVACSRAIHELHLFAAAECKQNGELARPKKGSLLAAGWKGLERRILERRIAEAPRPASSSHLVVMPMPLSSSPAGTSSAENGTVASIAAAAQHPAQVLRRLPAHCFADVFDEVTPETATRSARPLEDAGISSRLARVQGIVLHALLERAAAGASGEHPDWSRLADALLRQHGLTPADAATAHSAILQGMRNALADEVGRWLLLARAATPAVPSWNETSWNEISWTTTRDGRVQRQRPDRIFFAGESPGARGTDYLWIVDYKTASLTEADDRDNFLAASREQYRRQLESYSELFRSLPEVDQAAAQRKHRLAIYHPMLPWLDWW